MKYSHPFRFPFLLFVIGLLLSSCSGLHREKNLPASEILGNPACPAVCYGGFRSVSRESCPSVDQIKDDLKILSAVGIRIVRTYNTQHFAHAANLLEAIRELKEEDKDFEMYVMLGTWIECQGAWTSSPDHRAGNNSNNSAEIEAAIRMAVEYPDIVKVIAVGNEAMIHWAANYYVDPAVILEWVNYLQDKKKEGRLPSSVWITSSDNFAAWGGDEEYRTADLESLVRAVDYVSLHTYPYHETYYHPSFWNVPVDEEGLSVREQADAAMQRALNFAKMQYGLVSDYVASLGIEKELHIGETGWSTGAVSAFGSSGSHATDEYKQAEYYRLMREWTNEEGISCFFFEAFDEQWKDPGNPGGSENHFGLFTLDGKAKYALWTQVDKGIFGGLSRDGHTLMKTFDGREDLLMDEMLPPPLMRDAGFLEITAINASRSAGEKVGEELYVISDTSLVPGEGNGITYPCARLNIVGWDGSCSLKLTMEDVIELTTGTGSWWGGALELVSGNTGENLENFKNGTLNLEIRGDSRAVFLLGYQTGKYALGNQVGNYVTFGPGEKYSLGKGWKKYSIKISEMDKGGNLQDVTAPLYFQGSSDFDGGTIEVKNIYWRK